jgi:hypothetical protein
MERISIRSGREDIGRETACAREEKTPDQLHQMARKDTHNAIEIVLICSISRRASNLGQSHRKFANCRQIDRIFRGKFWVSSEGCSDKVVLM